MASYYDHRADFFVAATRDVDMSDARSRFLAALPVAGVASTRILDAGSGSGRDALAFRRLGYDVYAFDASSAMVAATRAHAGVPTRQMRFEDFSWEQSFEGIWACASLLHVAETDLPPVIERLTAHLVPSGALYLSFKLGAGERAEGGRRFTDMTEYCLDALLERCMGLGPPDIWQSRDMRPDRQSEVWVNAVVKKT